MISLYFHVPFCTKKCPYCHFYVIPNRNSYQRIFEEALFLEWEKRLPQFREKEIASIYFGGGTPTLFAPDGIKRILKRIREDGILLSPSCEITIEANPEETGKHLFHDLLDIGVNRLSLGVQSLDDRSLQTLERIHSAKKAKEAIREASEAGFKNISIDLMYDLPGQTKSSWDQTLGEASSLPIQHLSLYNLTIEPHTSFFKRKNLLTFPDQGSSLQMLEAAIRSLEKMGLKRYEISAFAREGFQSRHNLGYWTGRPFLGFGPSAFSFWEEERFRNIANLQRYARALKGGNFPVDFKEKLPYPQNLKELFAIRLRLLEGAELHPHPPQEMVDAIERLLKENYLMKRGSKIALTEKGLLFHDTIASEII